MARIWLPRSTTTARFMSATLALASATAITLGTLNLPRGFVTVQRPTFTEGLLQPRRARPGLTPISERAEVNQWEVSWTGLAAAAFAVSTGARMLRRRQTAVPDLLEKPRSWCATEALKLAQPSLSVGVLSGDVPLLRQSLTATRDVTKAASSSRGARIVAQARTPRGPYARFRRNAMWLDFSKAYKGRRRNVHTIAKRAVMKALKQKYTSRRLFKRERRTLWIARVRANSNLHGVPYCRFIQKLKQANININRKILSQLGIYDRPIFTNIMEVALPEWKRWKAHAEWKKPNFTVEEIDDVMIPHIEKLVPELYTDACIRFNRQVKDYGVEYTVDMGNPAMWREALPKMPELANFALPDHWMGNANAETEMMPIELNRWDDKNAPGGWYKFMEKVKKEQALDEEKAARGEPTWPKKEGVSREDWFKEEPQTWF